MARKVTNTTKKKQDPTPAQIPAPRTVSQKPVVSVGAIIMVVLLAGLVLLAVFMNQKKEALVNLATPTSGPAFVFDAKNGAASNVKVESSAGDTVQLVRNEKNAWEITQPTKAEANQGLAEAAASQIATLQRISDVDGSPDIFGLDKPTYTITVEFADKKPHTLEVGDNTPTNSGYYVRLDNAKIMIIDLSGIDAITNLMTPPYLNTPTPPPSPVPPTETPIPPAATATPTP